MGISLVTLILTAGVFLTIVHCCPQSLSTVTYVDKCPKSKTEWNFAATKRNCSYVAQNCTVPSQFQYHCLINPFINATIEVCAPRRVISKFCAEFNIHGHRIQSNIHAKCKKCPILYRSNAAYKYQECYGLVRRQNEFHHKKTTLPTLDDTYVDENNNQKKNSIVNERGFHIFLLLTCIITGIGVARFEDGKALFYKIRGIPR